MSKPGSSSPRIVSLKTCRTASSTRLGMLDSKENPSLTTPSLILVSSGTRGSDLWTFHTRCGDVCWKQFQDLVRCSPPSLGSAYLGNPKQGQGQKQKKEVAYRLCRVRKRRLFVHRNHGRFHRRCCQSMECSQSLSFESGIFSGS